MTDLDMSRRVKDQLPTVLLTMLSIVQALALELMWEHVTHSPSLYETDLAALLEWLQVAGTFVGVLLVWLIYASMVMRFRWIPTTGDLVFPFFVGVLEFLLVELLGVALLGPWLMVFATVFGLMTWASQASFKRARQDPENATFFANTAPATARDFFGAGAVVAMLYAVGLGVWAKPEIIWLGLFAVVVLLVAVVYQFYLSSRFWRRSVFGDGESTNPSSGDGTDGEAG